MHCNSGNSQNGIARIYRTLVASSRSFRGLLVNSRPPFNLTLLGYRRIWIYKDLGYLGMGIVENQMQNYKL